MELGVELELGKKIKSNLKSFELDTNEGQASERIQEDILYSFTLSMSEQTSLTI